MHTNRMQSAAPNLQQHFFGAHRSLVAPTPTNNKREQLYRATLSSAQCALELSPRPFTLAWVGIRLGAPKAEAFPSTRWRDDVSNRTKKRVIVL